MTMILSLDSAPPWATISPTGLLTVAPSAPLGANVLTVRATDGATTATKQITVNVVPIDPQPIATLAKQLDSAFMLEFSSGVLDVPRSDVAFSLDFTADRPGGFGHFGFIALDSSTRRVPAFVLGQLVLDFSSNRPGKFFTIGELTMDFSSRRRLYTGAIGEFVLDFSSNRRLTTGTIGELQLSSGARRVTANSNGSISLGSGARRATADSNGSISLDSGARRREPTGLLGEVRLDFSARRA